jgi:hypothetical protein
MFPAGGGIPNRCFSYENCIISYGPFIRNQRRFIIYCFAILILNVYIWIFYVSQEVGNNPVNTTISLFFQSTKMSTLNKAIHVLYSQLTIAQTEK